ASAGAAAAPPSEPQIPAESRLAHGAIAGFRPFADVVDASPTSLPADRLTGAAMHYTSGTTGKPKGVKRPLGDIEPDTSAELFTFLLALLGIQHDDGNVHLSAAPNYHTAVTTFGGHALHSKPTVVLLDKWDPGE